MLRAPSFVFVLSVCFERPSAPSNRSVRSTDEKETPIVEEEKKCHQRGKSRTPASWRSLRACAGEPRHAVGLQSLRTHALCLRHLTLVYFVVVRILYYAHAGRPLQHSAANARRVPSALIDPLEQASADFAAKPAPVRQNSFLFNQSSHNVLC